MLNITLFVFLFAFHFEGSAGHWHRGHLPGRRFVRPQDRVQLVVRVSSLQAGQGDEDGGPPFEERRVVLGVEHGRGQGDVEGTREGTFGAGKFLLKNNNMEI